MKKKRSCCFCLLVCFLSFNLFAETLYKAADAKTMEKIKLSDSYIAQKKYLTAYQSLGNDLSNEFIIAKLNEICINYFVQSIGHRMFALKDLAPNEDLIELRQSKGTFTMIGFDPVKAIDTYYEKKSKSLILEKSLGDYYFYVSRCYGDNWFENYDTLLEKAAEHYSFVYKNNFYTTQMLCDYGDCLMNQGNYVEAGPVYEKALLKDDSLYSVPFNASVAFYYSGDFNKAIKYAEKAIVNYKDYPGYLFDAYLLCGDSNYALANYNKAITYLDKAAKIYPSDYRLYRSYANVYLSTKDMKKTRDNLDSLFALDPTNPNATKMVMEICKKNDEELKLFFDRNLITYKNNFDPTANLEFYYGFYYYSLGDYKKALEKFQKAKENFIKAGQYSSEIQEAVESFISEIQKLMKE